MAFIEYVTLDHVPLEDRVADRDNIIQVHGIHSRTMRKHVELFRELMVAEGLHDEFKGLAE